MFVVSDVMDPHTHTHKRLFFSIQFSTKRPFPQMELRMLINTSTEMLHLTCQAHHSCAQTPEPVYIVFSNVFGLNDALIDGWMDFLGRGMLNELIHCKIKINKGYMFVKEFEITQTHTHTHIEKSSVQIERCFARKTCIQYYTCQFLRAIAADC